MGGCAWILCRSPIVAHHRPPGTQQCTQTPQTGAERPDSPICVHYRGHAGSPATQQCTQTPKTGAERPDPPICVHYCDPKATHNPSPQPNSVHKRPNPAPGGSYRPFVYTVAIPRPPTAQQCTQTPQFGAERPDPLICVHSCGPQGCPLFNSVHKRPKSTRRDPILPSVYTSAIPRPLEAAHGQADGTTR